VCVCGSIRGVRFLALGAAIDLCAGCMDKGNERESPQFVGNRHVTLLCTRKLPSFRPQVSSTYALFLPAPS